jgi:hypothetical protein
MTIALAVFTRLRVTGQAEQESNEVTEWNAGIILVGVVVMIFMAAKLTVIVWAPQYLEQEFAASPHQASRVMSNIFQAAFLGSLPAHLPRVPHRDGDRAHAPQPGGPRHRALLARPHRHAGVFGQPQRAGARATH